MIKLFGQLIAVLVGYYSLTYAGHVWRREHNPLGAIAVVLLALATVVMPFYILYLR